MKGFTEISNRNQGNRTNGKKKEFGARNNGRKSCKTMQMTRSITSLGVFIYHNLMLVSAECKRRRTNSIADHHN